VERRVSIELHAEVVRHLPVLSAARRMIPLSASVEVGVVIVAYLLPAAAHNEEGGAECKDVQALEIHVGAIHDVEGAGLRVLVAAINSCRFQPCTRARKETPKPTLSICVHRCSSVANTVARVRRAFLKAIISHR
jgi:hypothetical protein